MQKDKVEKFYLTKRKLQMRKTAKITDYFPGNRDCMRKKQSPPQKDGGDSRDKPAVILPAIENIVDEKRIILNLIKDKVPFCHEHLVVSIRRDICLLKEGKALGHVFQGAHGLHELCLLCCGCIPIYLGQKTQVRCKHSLGSVGDNNFIFLIA